MSRFFGPDQPPSTVAIPINSKVGGTVGCVFAVYFAPPSNGPPAIGSLAETAARWSDEHLQAPLRDMVAAYRQGGLLSIEVKPVNEMPPLPIDPLRYLGLGELDERVAQAATHLVLILGMDFNIKPRVGMWAALGASLGVRDLLHGVLFDPEGFRIIDPERAARWFTANGAVGVLNHISVPMSIGDKGLGWMTTRGLGKFGLPDLELRDVPPNLGDLNVLMNAVAQFLVEQTFQLMTQREGKVEALHLPAEVTVDRAFMARARGDEIDDPSMVGGAVTVALSFDPNDRANDPPMIRIERPPSFAGDTGVWLNHVASRLLGTTHDARMVKTSGDAMTRAHERALSELPRIKQKFVAGLQPGQVLYIKHGFPTRDGSRRYMWAAVNRWEGQMLTTQLANEPRDVEGLQLGMTVVLDEADIFDWMLQYPDDHSEGGYTSEVVLDEGHQAPSE